MHYTAKAEWSEDDTWNDGEMNGWRMKLWYCYERVEGKWVMSQVKYE